MAVHHAPSKAHVSSHARACACACASASECVDVSVLVGVCVVPTAGNTECTCNICHVHRGHLHDVHAAEQPVRKQIDVEEIWEERNRLMSEIDVLNFALDEESITSKDHSRRMGHIVTRLGELKDRLAQTSAVPRTAAKVLGSRCAPPSLREGESRNARASSGPCLYQGLRCSYPRWLGCGCPSQK